MVKKIADPETEKIPLMMFFYQNGGVNVHVFEQLNDIDPFQFVGSLEYYLKTIKRRVYKLYQKKD